MKFGLDARDVAITRQVHARVGETLQHDLKIIIPEYDLIDSTIFVNDDIPTGQLRVRIDFIFEPNGLK